MQREEHVQRSEDKGERPWHLEHEEDYREVKQGWLCTGQSCWPHEPW